MLNKVPGPDRGRLGFREAVRTSFRFLNELGLRPVEEKETFVRYESSAVFVNVYHGRASFELGVEIGRLKDPNEKLTLYDIVAWAGAEEKEGFGQHVVFQVSSPEGIREFVPKLARLAEEYGTPFLKNEASAYHGALEARSRGSAEYAKQVNLRSVRSKAQTAWHAKDHARVVELYGSMRNDLTEIEAKRMAYAEQQALIGEGTSPSCERRKR
jgi:hypothetical protein